MIDTLSLVTILGITFVLFYNAVYFWGIVFLLLFGWLAKSVYDRKVKQKALLQQYGYTFNPVMDVRFLMHSLEQDSFQAVKQIVIGQTAVLNKIPEWGPALELYKAFSPANPLSNLSDKTGLAGLLAENMLDNQFSKTATPKIIIVKMANKTVRIGWGLYLVSDKRLTKFNKLAKTYKVTIKHIE